MFITFIEKYPFILAFLLGLVPALIWMWFWLKEDTHPEPHKMLTLSFFGGMAAVFFVLPLQKIVYNYLFLIQPIQDGNVWSTIINSNLRFVGASLLHIMSSATIGIFMGLSFYRSAFERRIYTFIGIMIAIVLHTSFNLFILNEAPENIFFIFGMVWVNIVILLLLFEKDVHLRS